MNSQDIRWKQRLANLSRALVQLESAVTLSSQKPLSDLEKQGLIQAFEFTHELAWNVMKDYFDYQGAADLITGSRDASREAFQKGLVKNGEAWMDMIKSRNMTSHTYNQAVAQDIVTKVLDIYHSELRTFHNLMESIAKK